MHSIGGFIQDICLSLEEFKEDYPDEEYLEIEVDGVSIELDCGNWLSMDSIGLN